MWHGIYEALLLNMIGLISPPFNSTAVILRTTTCHYRGAGMKLSFLPLPQFQWLNTDSPPLTRFFKTVENNQKQGLARQGLAGFTYSGGGARWAYLLRRPCTIESKVTPTKCQVEHHFFAFFADPRLSRRTNYVRWTRYSEAIKSKKTGRQII